MGFSVEIDLSGSAFKKQFARADRSGAVACLIIGDEEAESQEVKLKWMATKEQSAIGQSNLLEKAEELRCQIDNIKNT